MDLVDQHHFAVGSDAELIFRVDEDEPRRFGNLGSPREERQRDFHGAVPSLPGDIPFLGHLGHGEPLVVLACLGLRRRRDDRLGEPLVLRKAFREIVAVDSALALGIAAPKRGGSDAGDVPPDDHLDGQGRSLADDRDVGIGHGHEVVGRYVRGLFVPPGRQLVEHLPFPGHGRHYPVEGGDAVRRHHEPRSVVERVPVADLAGMPLARRRAEPHEGIGKHRLDRFLIHHR